MAVQFLNKIGLKSDSLRKLELEGDVQRFGHTLGLSYSETLFGVKSISSEGSRLGSEIKPISQLVDEYVQQNPSPNMKKVAGIIHAAKKENNLFNAFVSLFFEWDIKSLFTILTHPKSYLLRNNSHKENYGINLQYVQSPSHIFFIVYSDNYLAVSNRGGYILPEFKGMNVFRINRKIAKQLRVLRGTFGFLRSQKSGEKLIKNLLAEKDFSFEYTGQKVGNCGFANVKSAIKPMLYMLDGEKGLTEYKKFTKWIGDREIKALLKKYLYAKENNDLVAAALYMNLIILYLGKCLNVVADKDYKPNSFARRNEHMSLLYKYLRNDNDQRLMAYFNAIISRGGDIREVTEAEDIDNSKPTELEINSTSWAKYICSTVIYILISVMLPQLTTIVLGYMALLLVAEFAVFHYMHSRFPFREQPSRKESDHGYSAFSSKSLIISNIYPTNRFSVKEDTNPNSNQQNLESQTEPTGDLSSPPLRMGYN